MKKIGNLYIGKSAVFDVAGASRTRTTIPETDETTLDPKKNEVARWGSDNNYPETFLKELRKNGAAGGGLRLLKSVHYGGGFVLKKTSTDAEGKREESIYPISQNKEIKDFFKRNKMPHVWINIISDLETFSMAYPEFILSKDRKKIVSVHRLKTAWARKEQHTKEQGFSTKLWYNARWKYFGEEKSQDTGKTHIIPSWFTADEVREYCKQKNIWKFCMPLSYPTTDEGYYTKTDWHAVYHNGWFDVSNSIPKFKKALFQNQLNVKYIVYIDEKYFEKTYGDDWDKKKVEEKDKIHLELVTNIDEHMTGDEAAGRSFYSPRYQVGMGGQPVDGISIEPIDNNIKDGSYLPDASAANSEILFALGVDPSLIGHGVPGGKLGAGSGSDKREAFTILQSLYPTRRLVTLQIWDLIQDYNGWDDSLTGAFENVELTTLDKNPTGSQKTIE